LLAAAWGTVSPSASWPDPAQGFRENWSGTFTGTWAGYASVGLVADNPGSGGVDGEGFLRLRQLSGAADFGAASHGNEFTGDWIAAGIQFVRFSLSDLGSPTDQEIHFCIGNGGNLWQYNTGFVPSSDWVTFTVDLSSQAFTQIAGTGTFTQALRNVDQVHIRNDHPPFTLNPDDAAGQLGIDRLILLNSATAVRGPTWASIKSLYR
jgi:hypothetical protein